MGVKDMSLETLHDVFLDNLKDLLSAEKQLVKALPKLVKAASNEQLQEALQEHLEVTRGQVDRLIEVFAAIEETARAKHCKGMEGLIEEGNEILEHKKEASPSALDAAIIVAAQKVEHYEISSYGSVRTFAEELGYSKAAKLLQQTLDEESEANETLNEIAATVNEAAMKADESEDEEAEETASSASNGSSRGSGTRGRNGSKKSR
jgi:ferritin-like metal-binding protein YciE